MRDPLLDGPCPVCDLARTDAHAVAAHNVRCGTPTHGERSYTGRPRTTTHATPSPLAPDGLTPAQWLAREYPLP